MAFSIGQYRAYSNPGKPTGGAQTKDFSAVSQADLTRSFVSPVAQANFNLNTALQEALKIYG